MASQFAPTENSSLEHPVRDRLLSRLVEDRAAQYGDRQFLDFKGTESVSYRELNERTNRFANGLQALGLAKEKKLAVMLPNCPEYLYLLFGASRIGAVTVPINTAYKGALLAHIINNSDAEVLVIDEQHIETINEIADTLSGLKTLLIYSDQDGNKGEREVPLLHWPALHLSVLYEAPSEKRGCRA